MKHKIEQLKLNNGCKLINVIVNDISISIVSLWLRAGSRFDPKGKDGLAHFVEHLYMKKTQNYPDEIERLRKMESMGIRFNAITSYETAHYFHIQQDDQTYNSIDLLIDGMNNSVIDDELIGKEKNIVLGEMMENKNSPKEYIWNLCYQGLWQNSSMGKNFFGDEKSVNSFNKADIEKFIENYYGFENSIFVIIGSESTKKLAAYLNEKITNKKGNAKFENEKFSEPNKISILKNTSRQVSISLAYKTCSIFEEKELVALDFIREYLSNKWMSKLIEELRLKRNITYWVDGETVNYSDTGIIRFDYSCDKADVKNSLKIVFDEVEKIKTDDFLNADLNGYKKSFLSSLAIRFTDPYEYLWWYGWQSSISKSENLLTAIQYGELIAGLSASDIQKAAQKYLTTGNMTISAIGDIEESEILA